MARSVSPAFTLSTFVPKRNLGVVLCTGYPGNPSPAFFSRREGEAEVADIGTDRIAVNQAEEMGIFGVKNDALALIKTNSTVYEISVHGLTAKEIET